MGDKAVVLLSGGLDSATTLAAATDLGYACYTLSFRYGQRHAVEIASARRVAVAMGAVEHRVIAIDLSQFGGSALTDPHLAVPRDNPDPTAGGIPITYVPARTPAQASVPFAEHTFQRDAFSFQLDHSAVAVVDESLHALPHAIGAPAGRQHLQDKCKPPGSAVRGQRVGDFIPCLYLDPVPGLQTESLIRGLASAGSFKRHRWNDAEFAERFAENSTRTNA